MWSGGKTAQPSNLCGWKHRTPPRKSRSNYFGPTNKHKLRTAMAAQLSFAPLLSTCTQHLRPFQSRTNIHFHFPSLPIPLSLSTFPFSSSTATTRGKVLCQTAGAHFFDAQNAVEAGQDRLLKVLSLTMFTFFYPSFILFLLD